MSRVEYANQPDLRIRPGPETTPWWLVLLATMLACMPLIIASQIAAHLRSDVVDDQMFGYFGWRITQGAAVYRDVWDNKPPGIYWINALGFWLGAGSYAGVVALCALSLVATHVLFFVVSASVYFRSAAALATLLASFYISHGYFQGGTNRTETFLMTFELAAVACYMRSSMSDRNWLWLFAGILCGCACLFKQVGLAAWGTMGLHTIVLGLLGDIPIRTAARRCILLACGAALPLVLAAAALASQGVLADAWFASVTFNRLYFERGDSSLTNTFANRYMLMSELTFILKLPLLMAAVTLIHAFLWWLRPLYRPVEIEQPMRDFHPACPRPVLLFSMWFLVAFYGATISPHHFRHYLLPTFPPLLLLGGYLINVIKTEIGLVDRLQQRAWVIASFVAMGYFSVTAYQQHVGEVSRVWVDRVERKRLPAWEVIGSTVASLTRPTDTIWCWGYNPGVYLAARRTSPSRFITTEKMGQLGRLADFQQDEMLHSVLEHPPAIFLASVNDYGWMTDSDNPERNLHPFSAAIGPWLRKHYVRVADIPIEGDNIYVFRRIDLEPDHRPLPSSLPGDSHASPP